MTESELSIDRLRELFFNREDVFALQQPAGHYHLQRQPLTDDVLRAHLAGTITVGAYSVSPNGLSRWFCLDSDSEGGDAELARIQQDAAARGLHSTFEASRRGGHLWFFCRPTPAAAVRRLGVGLLGDIKAEVYPKQTFIDEDGFGSLVRLPFGIHRKTGQRYQFGDGGLDSVRVLSSTEIHNWAFRLSPRDTRREPDRRIRESTDDWRIDPSFAFDWIDQHITRLNERGQGSCPLHPPDRSHSFNVSREKGVWCCWHEVQPNGKQLGGSLPYLVMLLDGCDFPTALKRIGVGVDRANLQNIREETTASARVGYQPSRTAPTDRSQMGSEAQGGLRDKS